jgi:hypothetical protein
VYRKEPRNFSAWRSKRNLKPWKQPLLALLEAAPVEFAPPGLAPVLQASARRVQFR